MLSADSGARRARYHRPEIEGLRAVAALLVAGYHVWFGRVSGGVDVFFVIAGFLVTGTLLGHLERTGRINIGSYLGRLLARLLPHALLVLGTVALAAWWLVPLTRRREVFVDIIASAAYAENWALAARSADYLDRNGPLSPVQHFWAMSIQGQFYLIWVALFVVVLMGRPRSLVTTRRMLTVLIGVLASASFAFSLWLTASHQMLAYFHTGTRVWEFGVGAVLALTLSRIPALPSAASWLLGWAGLAMIVSTGALLAVGTSFPGYAALWPVAGAALILWAGEGSRRASVGTLLSWQPLVTLGSVSYGLYLWHWPVLVFALSTTNQQRLGAVSGLAVIALSIALAFASTRLVERPLRQRLGKPGRAKVLPLALAALIVSGLGAGAYAAAQPIAEDPAVAASTDLPDVYADGCHQGSDIDDVVFCEYGDSAASRVMILIGGSHSAHWQPALDAVARERGWRLMSATKSSCRPGSHLVAVDSDDASITRHPLTTDADRASCRRWNADLTQWVIEQQPDLVALTASVIEPAYRQDGTTIDTSQQSVAETVPLGYSLLWDELLTASPSTEIVALRDTPRPRRNVPDCLATEALRATGACDTPRDIALPPAAALPLEGERLSVVDLTDDICTAQRCPAIISGAVTFSDDQHLTQTFSASLASALLQRAAVLR